MYGKNNYVGVVALAVAGGAAIYFWRKSTMMSSPAAPAAPVAAAATTETNAAGGIADLFRDVASDLFGLTPQTTVPPAV